MAHIVVTLMDLPDSSTGFKFSPASPVSLERDISDAFFSVQLNYKVIGTCGQIVATRCIYLQLCTHICDSTQTVYTSFAKSNLHQFSRLWADKFIFCTIVHCLALTRLPKRITGWFVLGLWSLSDLSHGGCIWFLHLFIRPFPKLATVLLKQPLKFSLNTCTCF